MLQDSYDCIVAGAGPAGCTTAAIVAKAGYSTLLVERESFPRFHVGESLMPEIYWTLQRLGLLEKMRSNEFISKVGVQFVSHSGRESQPFFFNEHDPRECAKTWHVERSEFDQMLFDCASDHGAECHDQTRVMDVRFEDNESQVQLKSNKHGSKTINARVFVDATGQSALLGNRLGIIEENPDLRKASIWTYFKGADRCEANGSNTTIILHTNDKSAWFWYIPLKNDLVSVGVVSDNDYLLKNRGSIESTFLEEVEKCEAVKKRIGSAERVEDFRVAKEFSYTTDQHAGDGWVLVGDAFGFIDPVYSSGVFLALKSGELAADAIVEGLKTDNLTADQLGNWTGPFESGVHWMRKLVSAFYTNEFSFGAFMKEHPHFKGNLTDLLIGRVFDDGVGKIFESMDPAIQQSIERAAGNAM